MASLEQAAHLLRQGRGASSAPIGRLPAHLEPRNVDEAMALQAALNDLLAKDYGPVKGTKIGCTTRVMQEYLGMTHPCAGAIFSETVHQTEAVLDFAEFSHVGVECEIAATLNAPIFASDGPHTLESVAQSVGTLHAAIEIVDDRYVDFAHGIPDWRTWVADNFFGAGAVLGEGVSEWREVDLPSLRGVMTINGRQVGSGLGRDIIQGHPLEALVWLANQWSAAGKDLPAAWLVMLGSVVQTHWLSATDVVEIQIDKLGHAELRFTQLS